MSKCPVNGRHEKETAVNSSCRCYTGALEPSDDCPVHGDPYPRCVHCHQFMSRIEKDDIVAGSAEKND